MCFVFHDLHLTDSHEWGRPTVAVFQQHVSDWTVNTNISSTDSQPVGGVNTCIKNVTQNSCIFLSVPSVSS